MNGADYFLEKMILENPLAVSSPEREGGSHFSYSSIFLFFNKTKLSKDEV